MRSKLAVVCRVFLLVMVCTGIPAIASAAPQDGYDLTASLWAKAVLQVPGAPVALVWKSVGTEITPSGARVVSGYFFADPADFAYGSPYNPEVFVKVYIDPSGWANIAFNHVTVDNVDVYSSHNHAGTADQSGTLSLSGRLIQHQYNGVAIDSTLAQSGSGPAVLTVLSAGEEGTTINSGLWARAVLQTATGPVILVWKTIGSDTTTAGDRVVSGYFYADPADFAYGSQYNPEVFVKIYIAANGWANMAYNHVTVDAVDISSAHNYAGSAQQAGSVTLDGRLIEHQYQGVVISADIGPADIEGVWLATLTPAAGGAPSQQLWSFALAGDELTHVREKEGQVVGTAVSLSGTGISFSYESGSSTVTVTGTAAKGLMSGTWSDTAGGSGTWTAGNDIRVQGARTTIYGEGETLMVMEQDGGGTTTFYGSLTPGTGEPTFTRIVCETDSEDVTLTLDASERLSGLTIGTLALTVTYNPDGSYNVKIVSDGQTVLDQNYPAAASLRALGQFVDSACWCQEGWLRTAASETDQSATYVGLVGECVSLFLRSDFSDFSKKKQNEGISVSSNFIGYLKKNEDFVSLIKVRAHLWALYLFRLKAISKECEDPNSIIGDNELCKANYKKATTSFVSYINLLNEAAGTLTEQAWENFLADDLIGTFKGSYTISVWGCQDGTSNTFAGSMTIKIDSISGNTFSGTFTGVLHIDDSTSWIEHGTINGTIDGSGNVSGTTSHDAFDSAGEGTFSGTYDYETEKLDITNDGHDTSGDTCSYSRIITTTKT